MHIILCSDHTIQIKPHRQALKCQRDWQLNLCVHSITPIFVEYSNLFYWKQYWPFEMILVCFSGSSSILHWRAVLCHIQTAAGPWLPPQI